MKTYEIHHEVGIDAKPAAVYKALTDVRELSKWWTKTLGSSKVGGTLEFWFDEHLKPFRVTELKKNKLVTWKVLSGDGKNWGTGVVRFELKAHEGQTFVHFTHTGWKSQAGDLAHCTTKWGVFMLSLKSLLEKGKGRPYPKDVQVS